MSELKRCPFCGGEAGIGRRVSMVEVRCLECWASTNVYEDISESVTAWNHRTDLRSHNGGRLKFGFANIKGEIVLTDAGRRVAMRIIEMRDAGFKYAEIQRDPEVHHPDGKSMSISSIQSVLRNREVYENG